MGCEPNEQSEEAGIMSPRPGSPRWRMRSMNRWSRAESPTRQPLSDPLSGQHSLEDAAG